MVHLCFHNAPEGLDALNQSVSGPGQSRVFLWIMQSFVIRVREHATLIRTKSGGAYRAGAQTGASIRIINGTTL